MTNSFKKWMKDDDINLLKTVKNIMKNQTELKSSDISEISEKFGRTERSIKLRIIKNALLLDLEPLERSKLIGISEEEIKQTQEYFSKEKERKDKEKRDKMNLDKMNLDKINFDKKLDEIILLLKNITNLQSKKRAKKREVVSDSDFGFMIESV